PLPGPQTDSLSVRVSLSPSRTWAVDVGDSDARAGRGGPPVVAGAAARRRPNIGSGACLHTRTRQCRFFRRMRHWPQMDRRWLVLAALITVAVVAHGAAPTARARTSAQALEAAFAQESYRPRATGLLR